MQEESGLANGRVYDLQPGRRYRIVRDFQDFYGDRFKAGEVLTFRKRDFLPYHGGHTITFAEQSMCFQEEANAELLENLWDYLQPIED